MAKTKLGRDTEASPQQAFVDDPITLEPGSVAMTLTDVSSGATGTVEIEVPTDNGFSGINITSADGDDAGSEVNITSTTVAGEALVNVKALASGPGTATARLDAEQGGGEAEARVAVVSGATVVAGIVAGFTFGVGGTLVITDGAGATGDPGQALLADATVGSLWSALPTPPDQLTSAGAIIISAASGDAVLTLGADGSFSYVGDGGFTITLSAAGALETNAASVKLNLPTADPVAAGQLWNDTGTVKVSAG